MPFRVVLAQFALAGLIVVFGACSRSPSKRQPGASRGAPNVAVAGLAADERRKPLSPEETTPEIEKRAKDILDANEGAPIGTEVPFEIGAHAYVARIEEHYHEPGGARRPWGSHRGVTVYHGDK
jgi:hypothetical protein